MRCWTSSGVNVHKVAVCLVARRVAPSAVRAFRFDVKASRSRTRLICNMQAGNGSAAVTADQERPPGYRTRLDYNATLNSLEAGFALTVSVLSCSAYYLARAPDHPSIRFALMLALLFAAVLTISRSFLLERKHQGRLLAEQDLKDEDSVFRELNGTAVHYKLAQGIDPQHPTAVHCYHGFGANTFSWSYVYKALSQQLHAQVTKHDMPGFGLTQRPTDISGYSLEHNGRLGRLVMDAELAAAGVIKPSNLGAQVGLGVTLEELQHVNTQYQAGQQESKPAVSTDDIRTAAAAAADAAQKADDSKDSQNTPSTPPSDVPHDQKAGNAAEANTPHNKAVTAADANPNDQSSTQQHSASSPSSAESAQPASPLSSRSSWDSVSSIESSRISREHSDASGRGRSQGIKRVLIGHSLGASCAAAEVIRHSKDIAGLILVAPAIFTMSSQLRSQPGHAAGQSHTSRAAGNIGQRALRVLRASGEALAKRATGLVLWLLQPVLVLGLRILVRSRLFWVRGLSNAWHSREGVSDELIDAYRLPQLVRGWELGLVRFVRARVADSRSLYHIIQDAYHNRTPLAQSEQLAHTVMQQGIKVLILHGAGDRLVPVTNSKRLAGLIPDAELVIYQDCGHVPQEELPTKFIQNVKDFVDQC